MTNPYDRSPRNSRLQTRKASKVSDRLEKRLKAYTLAAAAGVCGLALAPPARADGIYVENLDVTLSPGYFYDLSAPNGDVALILVNIFSNGEPNIFNASLAFVEPKSAAVVAGDLVRHKSTFQTNHPIFTQPLGNLCSILGFGLKNGCFGSINFATNTKSVTRYASNLPQNRYIGNTAEYYQFHDIIKPSSQRQNFLSAGLLAKHRVTTESGNPFFTNSLEGQFSAGQTGYVGFLFPTVYGEAAGWVSLTLTDSPNGMITTTVDQAAFANDICNTGISIGATSASQPCGPIIPNPAASSDSSSPLGPAAPPPAEVPEPGTLLLLATGASAIAAWRKKKGAAKS